MQIWVCLVEVWLLITWLHSEPVQVHILYGHGKLIYINIYGITSLTFIDNVSEPKVNKIQVVDQTKH